MLSNKNRLVYLFCLFLLLVKSGYATVNLIPADTLTKWITVGCTFDAILIDVRETSEIAQNGIIASTTCKPYNFPFSSGVFDSIIPKLPKNTPIIVYCASGHRSGLAAAKLDSAGFPKIYSLIGGRNNWTGVSDSASHIKPASDLPAYSISKSTSVRSFPTVATPPVLLYVTGNSITINRQITKNHSITIFTLLGKNVFAVKNAFISQKSILLPKSIKSGFYLIRIKGADVSDNFNMPMRLVRD